MLNAYKSSNARRWQQSFCVLIWLFTQQWTTVSACTRKLILLLLHIVFKRSTTRDFIWNYSFFFRNVCYFISLTLLLYSVGVRCSCIDMSSDFLTRSRCTASTSCTHACTYFLFRKSDTRATSTRRFQDHTWNTRLESTFRSQRIQSFRTILIHRISYK